MPIGNIDNVIVRPQHFEAGYLQTLSQNVDVFNAGSNNTITFDIQQMPGDFTKTRFLKFFSEDLISHRDDTSDADVADEAIDQEEKVGVKTKRRIGPRTMTADSLFEGEIGDPDDFSVLIGNAVGEGAMKDFLNTGLDAAVAALGNDSDDLVIDATNQNFDKNVLTDGLFKFGDRIDRLAAIVAHSQAFKGHVKDLLDVDSSGDQVVFVTLYNADFGSMTRAVILTDSPALTYTDAEDNRFYRTMLLSSGAIDITQTRNPWIVDQLKTGQENIAVRIQGEHSFNVDLKGYSWNEANGGRNPEASALAATANWDSVVDNHKDKLGVMIETQ